MSFLLPNEIILLILIHLNRNDLISFTSTCYSFYNLKQDELFWRDLIQRKFQIGYCDPNQSWWNLLISGDASQMCSHINYKHFLNLESRKHLLSLFMNSFDNYDICLEPDCLDKTNHLHNIILKISCVNFIEIYCQACNRLLGFPGQLPRSEKFISRQIIDFMTQLPFKGLIQQRRLIEQDLFTISNENYTFLIEKNWFMTWINFLIGL